MTTSEQHNSKDNYYQARINRALKYLNQHLSDEIKITELASEAGFSLFHFQRIYRALTNESPYETLLRLRLEKAVFLLKFRPKLKIAEVAYESGFPSLENFSRQFKARFEMSPSAFKKDKSAQNSRIYQEDHPEDFFLSIEESRQTPLKTFEVTIEHLPEMPIAFNRGIFGADGSVLVQKYLELMGWAQEHGVKTTGALTRFGRSIDNPEVTPAGKYRYDFAVVTEQDYPLTGTIEKGTLPTADYATIEVQGQIDEVARGWDFLYKKWLPESGYMPLHHPALEEFVKGPEEIGWDQFNLKCMIPITKTD